MADPFPASRPSGEDPATLPASPAAPSRGRLRALCM